MREPIQQGSSQPLRSEGFGPFVERQVAGDQRGAAFIAAAEDLEQQFGSGLGQRHEAQFVDDQHFDRSLDAVPQVACRQMVVLGIKDLSWLPKTPAFERILHLQTTENKTSQ